MGPLPLLSRTERSAPADSSSTTCVGRVGRVRRKEWQRQRARVLVLVRVREEEEAGSSRGVCLQEV